MAAPTIPALAAQLLEDGTAVARAEVRLVRARVMARVASAKTAAIFLAAAALLAVLGLIAFVVGIVLSLSELVDPALAGLAVLVVMLVVAAVLGWLGVRRLSPRSVPDPGA